MSIMEPDSIDHVNGGPAVVDFAEALEAAFRSAGGSALTGVQIANIIRDANDDYKKPNGKAVAGQKRRNQDAVRA